MLPVPAPVCTAPSPRSRTRSTAYVHTHRTGVRTRTWVVRNECREIRPGGDLASTPVTSQFSKPKFAAAAYDDAPLKTRTVTFTPARRRVNHGYARQQAAPRWKRGRGSGWRGQRGRGLAGWWWAGRDFFRVAQRWAACARASVARVRRGIRRRVPRRDPRRVAGPRSAAAGASAGGRDPWERRRERARTRAHAISRAGRGLPRPLPEGGARWIAGCSGAHAAQSAPR